MTKKELLGAIDSIGPTQEQKEQMLRNLRAKQRPEPVWKKFRNWRAAAALAAVFVLLWFALPGDPFRAAAPAPEAPAMSDAGTEERANNLEMPPQAAPAPVEYAAADAEKGEFADEEAARGCREYSEDGKRILLLEGTQDLEAFADSLPEEALLLEESDTFRIYQVGEEIWEIRLEGGNTLLIRPEE